jgi:hypothetical protein
VLVVDDLVGWLVGRLADAGYKKVSTRLRGGEQDRALRQAVTVAVQATAAEIIPSDEGQAGQLAAWISGAFGKRVPVSLPPGQLSRLEALRAGIAGQLSVLDDLGAPVTGPVGASAGVVADRLTAHLIYEISARGSGGGPLEPLANQLDHDLTHSQLEELKDMVDRLLGKAAGAPNQAGSAMGLAGWPLAEWRDPVVLEVHPAVQPDDPEPELPVLPVYVPREHDAMLAKVVKAAGGASGIAVLVGGSSTGKTRACWQALELLRGLEPPWRLWHPISPSRPQAALAELPGIGPRTVVWLNEAQFYLDAPGGVGEQVAAGLREALRDPGRGPVLVLATLWPQFWDTLISRPSEGPDLHAQARELLAGHDIAVPAAFTPAQLRQLAQLGDRRPTAAATAAADGRVIQFLAGAPELLARFRNAQPAARALIEAAMDARRLGMRPALPLAFLAAAVRGYLTDTDWDQLDDDWLEQALASTAQPSKGVRGPVTRIRPRFGRSASDGDSPEYQLADYLDQAGRSARHDQIPPATFWAAASYADPGDLGALGRAAYDRGLYRDAAQLYKHAIAHGDASVAPQLVRHMHRMRPTDRRPARWAAAHAALDDPGAVAGLLIALKVAHARDQITALLARDPAAHAALSDSDAVALLLQVLREARAEDQATALAARAARGNPDATAELLARDPAAHVTLGDPRAVAMLLRDLLDAKAWDQVTALIARDPAAHVTLDNPSAVTDLLDLLLQTSQRDQVTALLARDPAAHVTLDDPLGVAWLLHALWRAGGGDQVAALADRAAAHAPLGDPGGVASLLQALAEADAQDQIAALLARDPAAHAAFDSPDLARLLHALREVNAEGQVTALATRAAAHAPLDGPGGVASLLDELLETGADDQVAVLLARDPARHVPFAAPIDVARLLQALLKAGASDQIAGLLARDPASHLPLYDRYLVAWLLRMLRQADAEGQAELLMDRLPGAGMFQLFCEQEGRHEWFRFGRKIDGSPAEQWGWEDLD